MKDIKDIYVFIVEDDALAKSLVVKYFKKNKMTYAAMFKPEKRQEITAALDKIED